MQPSGLPHPGEYLRSLPLTTQQPRQRNVAQMKEQSTTLERELNDEDIANLSDGEFKVLVIKMLTDLVKKWKKQMKDT